MSSRQETTQGEVSRGIAWAGIGAAAVGILDMLSHFILLAIMGWEAYGVGIIVAAVFPALEKATDLGLTAAIVQRDDHTPEKVSTLFWLNVCFGLVLSVLLTFVVGPLVAEAQGVDAMRWMIAAYSIKIIWQNIYYIPQSLMKREYKFKQLSLIRIIANFADSATKIVSAALGAGPWAFLLGPMANSFVAGITTQIMRPWRPIFAMRFREAWDWTLYGLRTSGSQIVFHVYTNVDYHICGYYFGQAAAGFYGFAYHLVLTPALFVSEVTTTVAFPVFSGVKHSKELLLEKFLYFTRINLVIVLAFLGVVFVIASDALYFTDYGVDGADVMRVLAIVGIFRALSFVIPPLLDGVGRAGLTLTYMLVAAVAVPSSLVAFAYFFSELGVMSISLGWAVGYPIAFVVLLYLALRQLDFSLWRYIRAIEGVVICQMVALGLGFGVGYLGSGWSEISRLIVTGTVTLFSFFALLAIFLGISPRAVIRSLKSE